MLKPHAILFANYGNQTIRSYTMRMEINWRAINHLRQNGGGEGGGGLEPLLHTLTSTPSPLDATVVQHLFDKKK